VLLKPSRSVHLPCYYYQLQEIERYKFGVASNDIMFKSDFLKIHPMVLNLKHNDEQAWNSNGKPDGY
jgi:hypothetical protein